LTNRVAVLVDPMLATATSILTAWEALRFRGQPKALFILALIASEYGVTRLQKHLPQAHLIVGAVDKELTAKGYIVPGLGDAGDLAYGPLHHG
jgi:uracil phosphoribosyltransferase